jgi:hypothetical protein
MQYAIIKRLVSVIIPSLMIQELAIRFASISTNYPQCVDKLRCNYAKSDPILSTFGFALSVGVLIGFNVELKIIASFIASTGLALTAIAYSCLANDPLALASGTGLAGGLFMGQCLKASLNGAPNRV